MSMNRVCDVTSCMQRIAQINLGKREESGDGDSGKEELDAEIWDRR